jgi:predicted CoA-binding protein
MNDQTIREVLTRTQRIALVGASDRPERPSYGVMKYLLDMR